MCGICGIWGEPNPPAVEAMITSMRHRGPDDRGIYSGPGICLGMTRLSILDLTPDAHQPMSNKDKTVWIVYNGEVYNFQTERKILEDRGYEFSSASDTEVVLRMYEHYGDTFLKRMRGMFALAIFDLRNGPDTKRLLLARDHFGIKPLLYTHSSGRLIFASEMKALLSSGLVEPRIDPVSLRILLTYGSMHPPHSIIKGVRMLPPAHYLIVTRNGQRLERFWSLGVGRKPDVAKRPYEEQTEETASVLEECTRLQMVSDVPLGAFLSGGVDSSVLAALMAKAAGHRVKTFSIGFEPGGQTVDESLEAQHAAEFLGTDHSRYVVTSGEVRDRIQHIAWSLDQPSFDGVNTYFVSLAAKQGVTVALSGTGADELFAGYAWFRYVLQDHEGMLKKPVQRLARLLLASTARLPIFDRLVGHNGLGIVSKARRCAGFVSRYSAYHRLFGTEQAAALLAGDVKAEANVGRSPHYDLTSIDEMYDAPILDRFTAFVLRGFTANRLLRDIDAMSMTHSLEVRVPYLDPLVADHVLSLPVGSRLGPQYATDVRLGASYRDTGAKRILVDLARDLLPEGFDMRPKRGFYLQQTQWLHGALNDVMKDTLSAASVARRGLLDPAEVSNIADGFAQGQVNWSLPWMLMMLELWCREVLDVPPARLGRSVS